MDCCVDRLMDRRGAMCENDLNSLPQKIYLSTDRGSISLGIVYDEA